MGNTKEINIKNRTYYFFSVVNNKNIVIYNIGYITIKNIDDYENIYSVNPMYLMIGEVIGYIEENHGNKYLVFDSSDKNKEVLKKYKELWDGIKSKIES